jgi:thiosulfate dehydrogenase (quinone) large subunit
MNIIDRTVDNIAERVRGPLIGLMRIAAGLLWLANIEWKRPPDFGRDAGNGLYKYVDSAVKNPVVGPFTWFIKHVVLKQYTLFGWITLITEVALAVCLLLGFKTRIAALVGAAMSVNILLSVLNYVDGKGSQPEWAWSYYLMIAVHLLLFAVAAGQHLGVDGIRTRGGEAGRKAIEVLGAVAIVVGAIGLILALKGSDFSGKVGHVVGYEQGKWELKWVWLNGISSLLTIGFGVVAVASHRLKNAKLALVAAIGFALMALQVLVQWHRNADGSTTGGILGGTGGTLAFWAMLAVGIAACMKRRAAST